MMVIGVKCGCTFSGLFILLVRKNVSALLQKMKNALKHYYYKMHCLGWYDMSLDTPCRTVRFHTVGLGDNKRCSFYSQLRRKVWKMKKQFGSTHAHLG